MKILTYLFLGLTLFGCSYNVTRGNILYDYQFKLLEKNLTKDQIIKIIGYPSIVSDHTDQHAWYYVTRHMQQHLISKPVLLSQTLWILKFDQVGVLQEFVLHTGNDIPNILPIESSTIVEGTNIGIIEHFIKNLGRFTNPPIKTKKH